MKSSASRWSRVKIEDESPAGRRCASRSPRRGRHRPSHRGWARTSPRARPRSAPASRPRPAARRRRPSRRRPAPARRRHDVPPPCHGSATAAATTPGRAVHQRADQGASCSKGHRSAAVGLLERSARRRRTSRGDQPAQRGATLAGRAGGGEDDAAHRRSRSAAGTTPRCCRRARAASGRSAAPRAERPRGPCGPTRSPRAARPRVVDQVADPWRRPGRPAARGGRPVSQRLVEQGVGRERGQRGISDGFQTTRRRRPGRETCSRPRPRPGS